MISFSQILACPLGVNVFSYHSTQVTIAYNNLVLGGGVSLYL